MGKKLMKNQTSFYDNVAQEMQQRSDRLKSKYREVIISEEEAIRIAKEYRQHKEYAYTYNEKEKTSTEYLKNDNYEYPYDIDWDHPRIRLEEKALKKNGGLSGGAGKKVVVWSVWFLPVNGIDLEGKRTSVSVDIDAKTGKVFTKYSWEKI